ncbi:MAG TPA: multifunctional oxoglutarate decarboxylase/oxoglutarate dehydrogenase thiamine pyrophosphate-binding subunit/dihydrolipoyllysine-residue succinyltransferase subunit, partial [Acidimicrobiales bacterium]|nr:multifunctional oxoglutarate decarboxylase/oxoglutarate dehydrogenase thiamine pyrophosphate-binding subunit/dihydrolipoyllysine-residue succinyltransferase subunit [Acidimicrobiales bacterium]
LDDFVARMQTAFEETRHATPPDPNVARIITPPLDDVPPLATGVEPGTLDRVARTLHRPPPGFTVHPKLAKQMEARSRLWSDGQVDWPLAEALAFGSLLLEGTDIRLSGQDSRRGTFSQRHSVLVDYETGAEWTPLASLEGARGKFWVFDSMLSEYAALGFEYGYSVVHKDALVAWEAQFGDFVNGAQVVVDQFIAAAEAKWGQTSGLVLLLPHGYEGQGPEHSSARLERFLTLCAGDNLCVANPTTAAQYFHILRRQVRRHLRKPLVLLTPKSLLRARVARSAVDELVGGSFREVLVDPVPAGAAADGREPRRLIMAQGKIVYDALAGREERGVPVPVVRVEQLFPWPADQIAEAVARYPSVREVFWLQEEPENMGAWPFAHERLHHRLPPGVELRLVSRPPSASPATGSQTVHQHEQEQLVERVLAGL